MHQTTPCTAKPRPALPNHHVYTKDRTGHKVKMTQSSSSLPPPRTLSIIFYQMQDVLISVLFLPSGKAAPNLVDPFDQATQNHSVHLVISYNKSTRRTNFSNLFWNETLHALDSSSVHHQEFFTVHTAMVYVIQVC